MPCSPGSYASPSTGLATIDSPAFFLPSPPPFRAAAAGAAGGLVGNREPYRQLFAPLLVPHLTVMCLSTAGSVHCKQHSALQRPCT